MRSQGKLKAKYGGALRMHWLWSLLLSLSLLLLDLFLFLQNRRCGLIAVAFTAVYFLIELGIYLYYRPQIMKDVTAYAARYGQMQGQLLAELSLPAALLDSEGRILWMNLKMTELTGLEGDYRKNFFLLFPQLSGGELPREEWRKEIHISFQNKDFRADISRIPMEELTEANGLIDKASATGELYMVYLMDETRLRSVIRENRERRPVVAMIYLDNFDEVMERTDEVHQSLLEVLAERKISKYFGATGGLIRKTEKDKYLAVLDQKGLDSMKEDRFSLMEGIKTINIGNEMRLTASIGIGSGSDSYLENYEMARGAMDMALARGGDQTVLKEGDSTTYYGGKTQRNERSTRVKARVKAQALRELILSKDIVIAMGHSNTDMDAFGAAVGICRAAMTVGKPAHIVLGELNTNIRDWVASFNESKDYEPNFFITHEQAMELVDERAAVVVVDTNNPKRVECPGLLSRTRAVVVLDHHRQTTDQIQDAALSYIEPSASSACEMVAELLQYFEDNVKLQTLEADSLYAGIIIDTHSFAAKAGVRTFEAAAYLRRCGADVTRVRKALRDDMQSYQARADAVRNAQAFMGCYAISVCHAQNTENPNVVGAQAANELLNIIGVKASFVVTPFQDQTYISARSIDEVNVQLVMERMGGGGHMNIAGSQLSGVSPEEAVQKIKNVLEEMTKEGAI